MKQIKKAIENRFVKIRGWNSFEHYDTIQETPVIDKNIREELITISIQETVKEINKIINRTYSVPVRQRIKIKNAIKEKMK